MQHNTNIQSNTENYILNEDWNARAVLNLHSESIFLTQDFQRVLGITLKSGQIKVEKFHSLFDESKKSLIDTFLAKDTEDESNKKIGFYDKHYNAFIELKFSKSIVGSSYRYFTIKKDTSELIVVKDNEITSLINTETFFAELDGNLILDETELSKLNLDSNDLFKLICPKYRNEFKSHFEAIATGETTDNSYSVSKLVHKHQELFSWINFTFIKCAHPKKNKADCVKITISPATKSDRAHYVQRQRIKIHTENLNKLKQEKSQLEILALSISHNLRNNASNMVMISDLIKNSSDKIESEQFHDFLDNAIQMLCNNLNNYLGTLSENKLKNNENDTNTVVCLNEIVKNVVSEFQFDINRIKAKIDLNIPSNCLINFPKKTLWNALHNLISNALKYQSKERILAILIGVKQDETETKIIVSDNGIGLSKKEISTIFDKQSENKITLKSAGLGLNMVKKELEQHGASISVTSKKNIGSNFTIRIK